MTVRDSQGKEISVGSRVVIIGDKEFAGRIGDVRAVKEHCSVLRGKPGLRVAHGVEGDPDWSIWIAPEKVTVVS